MNIKELKDRIYSDLITSFKNAITPLTKSLFEKFSDSLSATFQLLYIFLDRISSDSYLTSCTVARVYSYFAPLKNIKPKEASVSRGTIRFTGVNGTLIPTGTILIYNQLEYITSEDGTISAGFADIASKSVGKGSENNTPADIDLSLSIPIPGINNKATSSLGFNGAIDKETPESVRTRTKQKFATATRIDNDNTYKSLANEVDNVKASFISSIKNGVGTFGVTILTFTNDGVPIQADIDAVEQYFIDNNAIPTYVDAEFFLPVISNQDFDIQLAINNTQNQNDISQLIRDYLYLVQKPGTTFELQGLANTLQSNGARLISPTPDSSIVIASDGVLDLGVITWL